MPTSSREDFVNGLLNMMGLNTALGLSDPGAAARAGIATQRAMAAMGRYGANAVPGPPTLRTSTGASTAWGRARGTK